MSAKKKVGGSRRGPRKSGVKQASTLDEHFYGDTHALAGVLAQETCLRVKRVLDAEKIKQVETDAAAARAFLAGPTAGQPAFRISSANRAMADEQNIKANPPCTLVSNNGGSIELWLSRVGCAVCEAMLAGDAELFTGLAKIVRERIVADGAARDWAPVDPMRTQLKALAINPKTKGKKFTTDKVQGMFPGECHNSSETKLRRAMKALGIWKPKISGRPRGNNPGN